MIPYTAGTLPFKINLKFYTNGQVLCEKNILILHQSFSSTTHSCYIPSYPRAFLTKWLPFSLLFMQAIGAAFLSGPSQILCVCRGSHCLSIKYLSPPCSVQMFKMLFPDILLRSLAYSSSGLILFLPLGWSAYFYWWFF